MIEVLLAVMVTSAPAERPLVELSAEERKAALARDPNALLATVEKLSPAELIALSERTIAALNSYEATLEKQEKLRARTLPEAQVMKVWIREQPFAARFEVKGGPATGRKAVYDAVARPADLRVREAGMLGWAGALWIGIDSGLAKGDTRWKITELGLGALMRLIRKDFELASARGGMSRKGGTLKASEYCADYHPPAGVQGLHSKKTRLCFDLVSALPTFVEVNDEQGVIERYRWREVKKLDPPADFFTPKAAGL